MATVTTKFAPDQRVFLTLPTPERTVVNARVRTVTVMRDHNTGLPAPHEYFVQWSTMDSGHRMAVPGVDLEAVDPNVGEATTTVDFAPGDFATFHREDGDPVPALVIGVEIGQDHNDRVLAKYYRVAYSIGMGIAQRGAEPSDLTPLVKEESA